MSRGREFQRVGVGYGEGSVPHSMVFGLDYGGEKAGACRVVPVSGGSGDEGDRLHMRV